MARKTVKINKHADNSVICLTDLSADCVIVAFTCMHLTNHNA